MTVYSGPSQGYAIGRGVLVNVTVQVTRPANTTAYASGDALSDSTSAPTVLTLAGAAEENGHGGMIRGLTVVKSGTATTSAAFSILLFRNTFTALEDNAAADPSDAESRTIIAGIALLEADALALGNNVVWSKTNLDIPFVCESTSDDLYLAVVWNAAYTPASGEVFDFIFLIERSS